MAEVINVNEFKPGITFVHNNQAYVVIESSHSKQARGQAIVKVKAKNLDTNAIIWLSFTGGDKVEKAFVEKQDVQFLYVDGTNANFMNSETFEQFEIPIENITSQLNYMKEGSNVIVSFFEGKILSVETTKNVTLKVASTTDAIKGDTVTGATKKATLETGLTIDVPQFIKEGEEIIISTDDGKYVSKA